MIVSIRTQRALLEAALVTAQHELLMKAELANQKKKKKTNKENQKKEKKMNKQKMQCEREVRLRYVQF